MMVGVVIVAALVILLLLRLILNRGKPIGTLERKPERSARPLPSEIELPRELARAMSEGPGWFRIDGVDKETQMDTTMYVEARSVAAAKVKAELQGVVVTSCVRDSRRHSPFSGEKRH
jgi:hypothetical protein